MKLYRYFTEEDIEEYKIEDGKIYDEKSRIQSFAYINEDDVLPDAFILDSFKIYEVDLFGEKYFPDEYSSKIYANKLQILNEVNYEKFCNKIFNECTQEQLQVIKLKTDEILNKAITSEYNNCRAAVAIVGRDCDLDKLVYDKSEFVQSMVLSHKRPQDIKTLINNSNTKKEILLKIAEFDLYEVDLEGDVKFRKDINAFYGKHISILSEIDYSIFKKREFQLDIIVNIIKNKNEKLIDKYFNNNIFVDAAIAFFGRDCDLDKLVENEESRCEVIENILVHKREKDFKKYIKNNSDSVKKLLAKYGNDEILDTLIAEDNYFIRDEIINRKRIEDLKFYLTKKDLFIDSFIKIIEFKIDELFPLILERRKGYKLMYSDMDDAIYESYGDKSLPNLLDTTSETIIQKLLELDNEKYINYFLEEGNFNQKYFILDKFQNFDHAKKLIFDEDLRISEQAFLVLMNNDNRDLFKEKLNS